VLFRTARWPRPWPVVQVIVATAVFVEGCRVGAIGSEGHVTLEVPLGLIAGSVAY